MVRSHCFNFAARGIKLSIFENTKFICSSKVRNHVRISNSCSKFKITVKCICWNYFIELSTPSSSGNTV